MTKLPAPSRKKPPLILNVYVAYRTNRRLLPYRVAFCYGLPIGVWRRSNDRRLSGGGYEIPLPMDKPTAQEIIVEAMQSLTRPNARTDPALPKSRVKLALVKQGKVHCLTFRA